MPMQPSTVSRVAVRASWVVLVLSVSCNSFFSSPLELSPVGLAEVTAEMSFSKFSTSAVVRIAAAFGVLARVEMGILMTRFKRKRLG